MAVNEQSVTPKIDFNLTMQSPLNTSNQKGFKTEKTKVNLNLMEEGRDSSIYDTITTYTNMQTSSKKEPATGAYPKSGGNQKLSEGMKNLQNFDRSKTFNNPKLERDNYSFQFEDAQANDSFTMTQTSLLNDKSKLQLSKKQEHFDSFAHEVNSRKNLSIELERLSSEIQANSQGRILQDLNPDFDQFELAKIDEYEDDIIFSTLGPNSRPKSEKQGSNQLGRNSVRNIDVALFDDAEGGSQKSNPEDSEVPTPLKTQSSVNESQRDKNVLSRAIGEFAQEHSTAKKKKESKLAIQKNQTSFEHFSGFSSSALA